ncbi:MAG: MmgE/PrpD family protein [Actinomycetia bacterium]|nr:MmgE/PrpD family protein [Actinomycetes bacterium]
MTITDEILALAASAAGPRSSAGAPASTEATAEVTEADLAAFSAAAARGADSDVVRALLAIRPTAASALPSGDPAWTAWLTAAAATAKAGPIHPAWVAVFAAGTALSGTPEGVPAVVTATAAIAAGMSAAAIAETGLADWGGWSSGTVAAVIGAGVTAGLLLGLTQSQLRAALGICATQAAGLAAAEATQAFALQVGKAAFNGVEAALLARAGFTAPDEPLDGRRGLFALFG